MIQQLESIVSLSPARVVRTQSGRVEVALEDELLWAIPALSVPRVLHADDRVLVARDAAGAYVIGVIASDHPVVISAPGDLSLHAPLGRLDLMSGDEVRVTADRLGFFARSINTVSQSITECFVNATRAVKSLLLTRAGCTRQESDGEHQVHAERVISTSRQITKINGSGIHLG